MHTAGHDFYMANVTRFGAVEVGKTDNTEAIEHASTDDDGVMHFTSGTYRITKSIEANLAERGPLTLTHDLQSSIP